MGFGFLPDCFQFYTVLITFFFSLIPHFRGGFLTLYFIVLEFGTFSLQEMTAKIALELRGDFGPSFWTKLIIVKTLVTLYYGLNVFCIMRWTGDFWDVETMKLYRSKVSSKCLCVVGLGPYSVVIRWDRILSCGMVNHWRHALNGLLRTLTLTHSFFLFYGFSEVKNLVYQIFPLNKMMDVIRLVSHWG